MEKSHRPCEAMFGERSAPLVHEFVQRTVRECEGRCPLLDEQGESPLLQPKPSGQERLTA